MALLFEAQRFDHSTKIATAVPVKRLVVVTDRGGLIFAVFLPRTVELETDLCRKGMEWHR
jgi:hypothetical protein